MADPANECFALRREDGSLTGEIKPRALVGQGTHAELLESCPVYQEIYYSQFPKEAQNA